MLVANSLPFTESALPKFLSSILQCEYAPDELLVLILVILQNDVPVHGACQHYSHSVHSRLTICVCATEDHKRLHQRSLACASNVLSLYILGILLAITAEV